MVTGRDGSSGAGVYSVGEPMLGDEGFRVEEVGCEGASSSSAKSADTAATVNMQPNTKNMQ